MKKVITYGTFDMLHYGHINLLRRARALGDYLIVALSSDSFNAIKNKQSFFHYEHRRQMLEAIRYVDLIIPENDWEQKREDIIKHNVNIFVMGNDWEGKFDFLKDICEVVYLERTPEISTTRIKNHLKIRSKKSPHPRRNGFWLRSYRNFINSATEKIYVIPYTREA